MKQILQKYSKSLFLQLSLRKHVKKKPNTFLPAELFYFKPTPSLYSLPPLCGDVFPRMGEGRYIALSLSLSLPYESKDNMRSMAEFFFLTLLSYSDNVSSDSSCLEQKSTLFKESTVSTFAVFTGRRQSMSC